MEVFKTIENAPRFEINQNGEVRNKTTLNIIKHQLNHKGYPCVTLSLNPGRNSKTKKIFIHRALAIAFIDNPHGYDLVLHLDDNRENYSLDNLRWGTQKQNMEQSSNTGYYNTVKKEVTLLSPSLEVIEVRGLRTFCSSHGLDWGNFSKMVKGKVNSIKGWRLYNGYESSVSY
ncbi:HNH endonuclease [Klebsiella aerogenes]